LGILPCRGRSASGEGKVYFLLPFPLNLVGFSSEEGWNPKKKGKWFILEKFLNPEIGGKGGNLGKRVCP